jgi:hypothetical protein
MPQSREIAIHCLFRGHLPIQRWLISPKPAQPFAELPLISMALVSA